MRKIYLSGVALFVLFAFAACDKSDNGGNKKLAKAKAIIVELPAKIDSDNSFALDLFRTTCAKEEGNAFISPLSVSMALNMVLNGAEGETREQMLDALRAEGYTLEQINGYSKSLTEALLAVDPSTVLDIANSIWYDDGLPVKTAFISTNKTYYDAEVAALDFSSPQALTTINGWCKTKTKGRIEKILEQISPELKMCLVNAVYFKGIWVSPFDKKNTVAENFTTAAGQTQRVDMMRQTGSFNYTTDEECAYLELPYGNEAFSMVVMLPHEDKTTDDILPKLDNELWTSLRNNMRSAPVNLRLPRFRTECTFQMHEEILPEMGMGLPFTPAADFSGMSDVALYISFVIHKTFLEVNEKGTEAAAVTAGGMMDSSAGPPENNFFVDRPFILAIKENSTGAILFIGRIEKVD